MPLLGHRLRRLATEGTDGDEDGEAAGEDEGGMEEEVLALTGRVEGTGAVGTESNPVGYTGSQVSKRPNDMS